MIRIAKAVVNCLAMVSIVVIACWMGRDMLAGMWGGGHTTMIVNAAPVVKELQDVLAFAVYHVRVDDILEAEIESRWWRGVRGAWIVKGDGLIGIDVTGIVYGVDETNRHVALILPMPRVMQARVNHELTRTYDVQRGLFASGRSESVVRDNAMRQAQASVEAGASRPEHIQRAKQRIEDMATSVLTQRGWSLEIEWNCGATTGTSAQFGTSGHQEKTL